MESKRMSQSLCVVILMGLPAIGKSWLAKKLETFLSSQNCVVNRVLYDDIVTLEEQAKIALQTASEVTKQYRRQMKDQVEQHLTTPHRGKWNNVVIVDDNNYYRSMRYEYHQLAAKLCAGYLQLYVKCDVDEAVMANASRPENCRVPDTVILQMNAKLEEPSELWENCLVMERSQLNDPGMCVTIWNRIQYSIENPVSTLQCLEEKLLAAAQSKRCNDQNLLHNMDKVLRKKIGEAIRQRRESNARLLAENLKDIRVSMMEDVKDGSLSIPPDIWTADGTISLSSLEKWTDIVFHDRCSPIFTACT